MAIGVVQVQATKVRCSRATDDDHYHIMSAAPHENNWIVRRPRTWWWALVGARYVACLMFPHGGETEGEVRVQRMRANDGSSSGRAAVSPKWVTGMGRTHRCSPSVFSLDARGRGKTRHYRTNDGMARPIDATSSGPWTALTAAGREQVLQWVRDGRYHDTPDGQCQLATWRRQALAVPVPRRLPVDAAFLAATVDVSCPLHGTATHAEGYADATMNLGVLLGIIFGVLGGVALIALLILLYMRHRDHKLILRHNDPGELRMW